MVVSRSSSILLVFNPIHFDLVINQLIDVGHYGGALYVHEYEAGDDLSL